MEKEFFQYIHDMSDMIQGSALRERIDRLKPLGHFSKGEDGSWKPIDYQGFTVITPVCPEDKPNALVYETLLAAKKWLMLATSGFQDDGLIVQGGGESKNGAAEDSFVEAPDAALHMTVARLVSGTAFIEGNLEEQEDAFLDCFRKPGLQRPFPLELSFEVKGISVLPQGIIAAMVAPESSADYAELQRFRNLLYVEEDLSRFGVARKRGFQGHITLAYHEKTLSQLARENLLETIQSLNRELFPCPLPFRLHAAQVRRFNNYLGFNREADWPVFQFGGV